MNVETANQFKEFMALDVEVGGSLDNRLAITNIVYGDHWYVEYDQSGPYNFHSHPIDPTVLFSFYSVGDIIWTFRRSLEFAHQTRKDYLITEDGIYSLSVTQEALKFYADYTAQAEILFAFYQRYIIERKMNPFGYGVAITEYGASHWWDLKKKYACDIKEMVNLMDITGLELYEWMVNEIDQGKLSFYDKLQLASYVELPLNIGKIYDITFWPWGSL